MTLTQEERERIEVAMIDARGDSYINALAAGMRELAKIRRDQVDAMEINNDLDRQVQQARGARVYALRDGADAMDAAKSWEAQSERNCREMNLTKNALVKAEARVKELEEVLRWYEKQTTDCRKITTFGDVARQALDHDGGSKARAALGESK